MERRGIAVDRREGAGLRLQLDALDADSRRALKALASEPRIRILEVLSDRLMNISEIAAALAMPLSTATLHVGILKEAGLLRTELKSGERGLQKVCQRVFDSVLIDLPTSRITPDQEIVEVAMPIGAYVDSEVAPTCGLASADAIIGLRDDPTSFFEPAHLEAQLIWFKHGFLEYRFPNRLPPRTTADNLWMSMELCSEAPMHHLDWPSDITLWVNGIEIGDWTSPADFGGQRGVLTPDWWGTRNTQYGLLKEWRINHDGSFIDGIRISDTTIDTLAIQDHPAITVRIGVRPDARHVGGLNLFGRAFGNYPQDIVLRLRYHRDGI